MFYKPVVLLLFLICSASIVQAQNFDNTFAGTSACFLVYDLTHDRSLADYNSDRCSLRLPPNSTFKVPLSLMAFDQNIISNTTVFKWNGQDMGKPEWNHDQTPATWLKYSVVWVSQQLTPQLGLVKIKNYLKAFNYGNQDFTGGLTHAWLNSSLKISGYEQLQFLKAFARGTLPVSHAALENTKANMYLETSPLGWKLYGKTGSSASSPQPLLSPNLLQLGWFIGFIEKGSQQYAVVLNFTDTQSPKSNEPGGPRAEAMAKSLLANMGLY